jgi:hypothetical protein
MNEQPSSKRGITSSPKPEQLQNGNTNGLREPRLAQTICYDSLMNGSTVHDILDLIQLQHAGCGTGIVPRASRMARAFRRIQIFTISSHLLLKIIKLFS